MSKASKTKSQSIKDDIATVQVFARTGRLPIVSDSEEYLGPGVTPRQIPGITLEFEDGVCDLDPVRDAGKLKAFREWLEDGSDPRIAELGVLEIPRDALTPPFAKWTNTKPEQCLELVDTLGLDPELCLRYELSRGDEARPKIVKALEARVDAPAAEDPLSEPLID